jgi:hypothetical protein
VASRLTSAKAGHNKRASAGNERSGRCGGGGGGGGWAGPCARTTSFSTFFSAAISVREGEGLLTLT